jgi:uncharacterized protein YjbI with pentapeptide repeats
MRSLTALSSENTSFKGTNLQSATLQYADLRNASFEETNLQNVQLFLAQMQNTSYNGVQFQVSSLEAANLDGSFFNDTNLIGALLGGRHFEARHSRTCLSKLLISLTQISEPHHFLRWSFKAQTLGAPACKAHRWTLCSFKARCSNKQSCRQLT